MNRKVASATRAAIDVVVLIAAFCLALLVRFDWAPPTDMLGRLLLVGPYVIAYEYLILHLFGIHRFSWRFIGLREAIRVSAAAATFTLGLVIARFMVPTLTEELPQARHGLIPLGVIAANFIFAIAGIVGVRVLRRVWGERADTKRNVLRSRGAPTPIMLVGAGQAGVLVAKELSQRPELGLHPVGFLDDDPMKKGLVIHGIQVVGTTQELKRKVAELDAEQVLITMASAPGETVRKIRRACDEAGVTTKIIPGIYEIVGGRVNLSRIRDVAISDLLRRDPIELDDTSLNEFLKGRVVLVTGAGGSIGSELCRQIALFSPAKLVLFERAEPLLFQIHRELIKRFPTLEISPIVGDVTDAARVDEIFAEFRPHAVFHAAAHKHVPMMEWNPGEAVKNNVGGTRTVADASDRFGCGAFVMVSTDKAVNPTSVMGATKRCAELYVETLAERSQTRFVTVRFGNVLGSTGSVVPIFQEQIARGGPVTITHPDMRRYFMTIPEACQLVLQAGAMGDGGEIFILDMGEPVKIVDLAKDLIELSGFRPEDIEITYSGIRPGEKLFEELATDGEHAEKTRHPKIFVGKLPKQEAAWVCARINALMQCAGADAILEGIAELVPEFQHEKITGARQPDPQATKRDREDTPSLGVTRTQPA